MAVRACTGTGLATGPLPVAVPRARRRGVSGGLLGRLRATAARLALEVRALAGALGDPRVPLLARFVLLLVVAYALSPIDLVPDFIPVLGMLDELLVLPLGIWLALRLIPPALLEEHRRRAADPAREPRLRRLGAGLVLGAWSVLLAAALLWWAQAAR